jgi:hypothetical protein
VKNDKPFVFRFIIQFSDLSLDFLVFQNFLIFFKNKSSRPVFDKATKPTRPIVIHDCGQLELFGSSSENAEAEYQKYTLKLHLSFHIFIWQHFLLELSKCTFTYHLIEYRTSIKGDTLEVRQHSLLKLMYYSVPAFSKSRNQTNTILFPCH